MYRRNGQTEDTAALFEELLHEHEAAIYRVGFRLTGNHEDAEDLVQDALFDAFLGFDRFESGTNFDRWIFRILHTTYVDAQRRAISRLNGHRNLSLDDEGLEKLADHSLPPDARLMAGALDEPWQQGLMRLKPDQRMLLVLCDIEGLSYEEAAQVMGRSVGTVRSRLHRARLQLRKLLQPMLSLKPKEPARK
ncbi:MAG: sigma-70 family RNA polymerase sigma factor [Armatimonadetes bacterium]|nr:sigma-70 family RNA polymerase sigma factor [Armatimonadota bacterium]MDE2207152.1 sigma-70 family RNA polymerase sigma factor [Armatimonadota bacterium]